MNKFEEAGLNEAILKAIAEMGFENPTPIQEKVIEYLLNTDKDIVGLAQTGTGKTAAFGLPIIQKTELNNKNTQALILCPTRELCIQIARDLENFAKYIKGLNIVSVYGGASTEPQIRALKKGAQIVVGTPGRTLDLINRKKLKVNNIRFTILDEADEMLTMGFSEDLNDILAGTPEEKQTLLFSATMPKEIARISKKYMTNPEQISVRNDAGVGSKDVSHVFYIVNPRDRYLALKRIVDVNPKIYAIIFCRTRQETKDISEKLIQDGYNADALHGDLSQAQRDHVMKRFRVGHLQILVATDVAARGLDVNELTHVINYNLPDELDTYVHRSGRTGRAGRKGISVAIVHPKEMYKINNLEKKIGKKFEKKNVPDGMEVCEKQLFNLVDKVENIEVEESQIEPFLPVIYKKLEWLSREDLIKHFVSVEFNRFLTYYKNAKDINASAKDSGSRDDRRDRGERRERGGARGKSDSDKFSRFFINAGSVDDLDPTKMIGLINDTMKSRDIEVGRIDIMRNFSFFEVDKNFEQEVLKNFQGVEFQSRPISVELSKEKPKSDDRNRSNGSFRRRSGGSGGERRGRSGSERRGRKGSERRRRY